MEMKCVCAPRLHVQGVAVGLDGAAEAAVGFGLVFVPEEVVALDAAGGEVEQISDGKLEAGHVSAAEIADGLPAGQMVRAKVVNDWIVPGGGFDIGRTKNAGGVAVGQDTAQNCVRSAVILTGNRMHPSGMLCCVVNHANKHRGRKDEFEVVPDHDLLHLLQGFVRSVHKPTQITSHSNVTGM